jgi:hypothetical protein
LKKSFFFYIIILYNMPQIPSYGYDETTEGELNSAKRRVIGYMDSTHERLTEYPQKDPTNGRATLEIANLTDNIYLAIKSIDTLDSYIRTDTTIIDLLDRPQQAIEIKKTAKELISVNNTLRKINASYNKLRPNVNYVELSVWTDFTSSVDLLRRASYKFYSFMDKLIREEKRIRGEDYDPPPIFDGGDDDEAPPDEAPTIEEPIDALAPDGTLLPPPEEPAAPVEPPPGLPFTPSPPPLPPSRPPRPGRPPSAPLPDLGLMQPTPPTSGLVAPPLITGQIPEAPPLSQQDSNVERRKYRTRVRNRARLAGIPVEERDDIVKDAEEFEQREGRFADDDEIDVLIVTHKQLGARPPTAETIGMDIMIPQDTEALIDEVNRTVAQLTNQTMITELNRRVKAIEEEGRVGSIKKSNIQNLRKALAIAKHPVVTVNKRDVAKIPDDIKDEYKELDKRYRNSRDKLEPNMHYGKRAKFVDFLKANNIPYYESSVIGRIQAFETPMAAPFPAPPPPAGKRPVLPPIA